MQRLYYTTLDIAVIVSSMQLGCRDEIQILDSIWEGEKLFLAIHIVESKEIYFRHLSLDTVLL